MKKKRIIVVLIGISLTFVIQSDARNPPIPHLDQIKSIGVASGQWRGSFFTNGAARLYVNSGFPSHSAHAPEGSFSFEEIYGFLLPHLIRGYKKVDDETIGISLHFADRSQAFPSSAYIEDKDVIRKLMYDLRDKVVPFHTRTHFEELLRTLPLVPGDEPIPFTYDYSDEEAFLAAQDVVYGLPIVMSNITFRTSTAEEMSDREVGRGNREEVKEEVMSAKLEVVGNREEGIGGRLEGIGVEGEEEVPPPVGGGKARKTGRPSLLFYVGAGVLVCVGVVLFLTRRR